MMPGAVILLGRHCPGRLRRRRLAAADAASLLPASRRDGKIWRVNKSSGEKLWVHMDAARQAVSYTIQCIMCYMTCLPVRLT